VGISLCLDLKIDATLAIFRLWGKILSHIHSFITFERRGASMHSDYFKARTRISLYPHDVFESNPLISLSISSGLVGYKNTEFVGRLQEQV